VNVGGAPEGSRENEGILGLLKVLRRRWLIATSVVICCVAIAVIHQKTTAKSYAATASVAFQSGTLTDSALQVTPTGGSEPQREVDTEVLIAHSPEVAEGVRRELKTPASAEALLRLVQVEAAPNTDVLNMVATTGNAAESAKLANAFATQYIAFRTKSELESIEAASSKLQQQISVLPAKSLERTTLEASLQRLSGLRAVAGSGANIIGRASAPTAPTGKSLSTTVLLGLIAGIALALSCVLLIEALDRRIRTLEECEGEYRLPALASVPQSAFRADGKGASNEALESFRVLRSALDFAAVTRRLDTLLVTSAIAGEGKTTTAIELARVIALTGRKVVLLELDLRRPTFQQHFKLADSGGLAAALTEAVALPELLVQPIEELPQLSMLPAGRLPHNPSELLSSESMVRVISELAHRSEIVIIDAPPLNPVADTQVLLNNPAIHATLVVARVNHVKRDQVRRAKGILTRHMIEPVGLVLTGVSDEDLYGYGAYDGYGSVPATVVPDGAEAAAVEPPGKRASTAKRLQPS
jgi:capsular exopolysaccharide synthesis family protein